MNKEVDVNDKEGMEKILSRMAFPIAIPKTVEHSIACGVTKREWYAAMAMQALVAKDVSPEWVASRAVEFAEALRDELGKKSDFKEMFK